MPLTSTNTMIHKRIRDVVKSSANTHIKDVHYALPEMVGGNGDSYEKA